MSSSRATADHSVTRTAPAPPMPQVVEALRACLGAGSLDSLHALVDDDAAIYRLAELALHHRTANAVFLGMQGIVDGEHPAFERLQREYIDSVARHLRTLADLAELSPVLSGADIPWMVVKGPVLAEVLYPRPDLRAYDDLDILVPSARFTDAVGVMEAAGFGIADRNWSVILDQRRAQLHAVMRLGTVVDLHWHLLNRETVRDAFAVDMDDLFSRARTVSVSGQVVQTLDAEDTLAHLCVHAGLDGGQKLRSLKDIDLAVTEGVDWDRFVQRATDWRARLLVATMLDRAAAHLDTPVPTTVIRALHTSSVGARMSQRLQRTWSPEQITDEAPSAGSLTVRALRDNAGSTLRAAIAKVFGRRGIDEWKHIVQTQGGRSHEPVGSGVLGALHPSGDSQTKAAYLSGVGHAAAPKRDEPRGPVMLVCSTGGHLAQLHRLQPWWADLERVWVTFDKPDSRALLEGEVVEWAYHPTTRNIPNLLRNTRLAWRLLRRERPSIVVSDGAGVALPFFLFARLLGVRTAYIEVYDRIDIPSLTGRLCYPLSDLFAVQWEEQLRSYPKGAVIGRLL